ncbi:hypothetical protein [Gordonia paraffinivorans]|uniref:hypothetical protein n=1 Tax=Gordonia paraffinivorans TaxID=175628 RepID=UPI0014487F25|nr:hypothetical protein [Gordonia paraffinivorans]
MVDHTPDELVDRALGQRSVEPADHPVESVEQISTDRSTESTEQVVRMPVEQSTDSTDSTDWVSCAWVGDDGLERKARARGKTGIGPEFTRAEIEKRCEQNAAALARGEVLEIPEQVLAVPSTTVAPDRPRPQYLTEDGKPPWENERALSEYEA